MKFRISRIHSVRCSSPSMRREWIEITSYSGQNKSDILSPSMRREWIEINYLLIVNHVFKSPSMRREWIEITLKNKKIMPGASPSMRREWIEMFTCIFF